MKNIQNIQEVVQAQQAHTMILSGHIHTLYTKLAHLDKQIQIDCIYPHSQSDAIQLNALNYDPDIDGEPDLVPAIQPSDAESVKEDTFTGTSKSEDHTTICSTTNRSEHQPSEVPSDIQGNKHNNIKQQQAEHPSDYRPQLEDIPELETDEEDWDDGQFDNTELLYNHNSTEESDRIHHEYSAYFEKLKINNTALTIPCKVLNIIFLSQIIITTTHNQNSTRDSKIKMYTYPHPLYQGHTYMVW